MNDYSHFHVVYELADADEKQEMDIVFNTLVRWSINKSQYLSA